MPTVPYLQTQGLFKDSSAVDLSKSGLPISAHDQLLCKILGISYDVKQLWGLKQGSLKDNSLALLVLKQKINSRILLAQSQLSAVAAELDCEGERSDMAATYLDGLNSKRNTRLTISSALMGALTIVATAVTKNGTQTGIGVGGGILSAGLGAMTINPKGKTIEFYHEHNLLRTIWKQPAENTDYPDFVWKVLHEKQFSNKGDISLVQSIKNRWLQFEFSDGIDPDQEKLLFGAGGFYHSDDLHTRSAMINQLQSTIRSIHQDFISLMGFIEAM
ncbi:MAG: hypothetical protein JWR38_4212 [Mucilaginibacter sp.]|nr:hypothetical protein [Mucilaginibacter sp.]